MRVGRRAAAVVVLGTLLGAACFEDRPRPSPVGPGVPSRLLVEVLAPAENSTVAAGQPVAVEIAARDLDDSNLLGLGFVAYRQQGALRIDSVTVLFPAGRSSARDTFELVIPSTYATNTQVDVYGLALGRGGAVQTSVPRSVVVIAAAGQQP